MFWQKIGNYEYEVNRSGYAGWCRCVNGRLADERWPAWNVDGEVKYL